jgi:hypothetical protein
MDKSLFESPKINPLIDGQIVTVNGKRWRTERWFCDFGHKYVFKSLEEDRLPDVEKCPSDVHSLISGRKMIIVK